MGNCKGNCESCGGCARELTLTEGELELLNTLAQIPFLPVARKADDMTPIYLEEGAPENCSLVLQALEKKNLVDLDYGAPLKGFDMSAYVGYPVHGTVALTARGQMVVDLLDKQGVD